MKNNWIGKIINNIVEVLFPVECLSCELSGSYLCDPCASKIIINDQSACLDCGSESVMGAFCGKCRPYRSLDRVLIAVDYDQDLIHRLIWLYKYHFIKDMTPVLGKFFLKYLNKNKLIELLRLEAASLVPIPLFNKKQKYRGFNQARELASFLSQNVSGWQLNDCLLRTKDTGTQLGLDKISRRRNVDGVFEVTATDLPQTIIIIDDVVTTGSTLDQAAQVLKERGVSKVYALILAKKGL